tara:strand:+ start:236 stop:466 length:231 start_codon:yes stop_codon:yes gene_type:complete
MIRKSKITYEFIIERDFGNNIISLKEVLNFKNQKNKNISNSIFLESNISYEFINNLKKTQISKNNMKTISYKKKND